MNATTTEQFVFPDDNRWDDARQAWNLAVDQRPAVVALPTSVDDVIAPVRWARSTGRSPSSRSGCRRLPAWWRRSPRVSRS